MKKLLFIFLLVSVSVSFSQTTTQVGVDLVKYYEGFRSKSYKCPANVWTIGYGSTEGVTSGMVISRIDGEKLLKKDLKRFESHVNKNTTRILRWHEFDALVSFTFNVGYRIKDQLKNFVNQGNVNGVVNKLMLYNKARVNGVLIVLPGLTKRRNSESKLYSDGVLNIR